MVAVGLCSAVVFRSLSGIAIHRLSNDRVLETKHTVVLNWGGCSRSLNKRGPPYSQPLRRALGSRPQAPRRCYSGASHQWAGACELG